MFCFASSLNFSSVIKANIVKYTKRNKTKKGECDLDFHTLNVSPYASAVLGMLKDVGGSPGILASLRYD